MLAWVRSYENGEEYLESAGGIAWYDALLPSRWHPCMPQTRGNMGGHYTERCACGAARDSSRGPWTWRNQTRKNRRKRRKAAV
jgi:hypothetical protein